MSAIMAQADCDDLEALFDSIVKDNSTPAPVAAAQAEAPAAAAQVEAGAPEDTPGDVMGRIGRLTRTLHDALRELGYDQVLEKTAASIPDARDRLDYVVKMTEQAAVRRPVIAFASSEASGRPSVAENSMMMNENWPAMVV